MTKQNKTTQKSEKKKKSKAPAPTPLISVPSSQREVISSLLYKKEYTITFLSVS
jgi:hypothetical protein